jgi:hypothetical protein
MKISVFTCFIHFQCASLKYFFSNFCVCFQDLFISFRKKSNNRLIFRDFLRKSNESSTQYLFVNGGVGGGGGNGYETAFVSTIVGQERY